MHRPSRFGRSFFRPGVIVTGRMIVRYVPAFAPPPATFGEIPVFFPRLPRAW
jgi:hypothetical protein